MKTYARIDLENFKDKRYNTIADVVEDLEAAGIDADDVEVDVYNADDDSWIEGQTLTKTLNGDSYVFVMYSVWDKSRTDCSDGGYYKGEEVYYNSKEEAREVLSDAPAGEYSIDGVEQSVNEYFETVSRTDIEIEKVILQ